MSISAQSLSIDTFVPMLRSLSSLLGKGAEHAKATSMDLAVLVHGRLAPDMFTLGQQVQFACFHATDAVARLTGRASAPPEDIGAAFSDLELRVQTAIHLLEATPAGAFAGSEDRVIVIPRQGTEMFFEMTGAQFLRDWALPHFYFHVVTAYDILRHLGVAIGKRDYVGNVARYLRQRPK